MNPDETLLEPPGDGGRRDGSSDAMGSCATACDDGIACTVDRCDATNRCVSMPDNSRCAVGLVCDARSGCVAQRCTGNAQCDNGNMCDGVETCMGGSCRAGTPLRCDDGQFCTGLESCDPTRGCVTGRPPVCDDGDPCTTDRCNPEGSGGGGSCENVRMPGCGMMMGAANDTCARATGVTLLSGSTTVEGNTLGAGAEVRALSCNGAGGDVWFAVTYPGRLDLELVATPTSETMDPVLVVRDSCAGGDLACNDDAAFGSRASRVWVRSTGGGSSMRTVYVVVDSFARESEGPFTLRATVSPAVPGASCTEGTGSGLFDVTRGGTVLHAAPARPNRTTGSCTMMRDPARAEEAYLFTGAARSTAVQVTARGATPSVYVRSGSCSGTELNCQNSSGSAVTFMHPGGSSYLYVDDLPPSTPYALTVRGVMP